MKGTIIKLETDLIIKKGGTEASSNKVVLINTGWIFGCKLS